MSVRQQLREYVFGSLLPADPSAQPGDDDDLFDRGLDSLRVMRLLIFIERELGVKIPDHEVTEDRVQSISALARWVEAKQTRS